MTLKEKFRMANMVDNGSTILEKYQVIADEFAIGFTEWCTEYKRIGRNGVGDMQYSKDDYDFAYTMEELLEIYKKEKGL